MESAASTLLEQLRVLEPCLGADELERLCAAFTLVAAQSAEDATELEGAVRRAALNLLPMAQAIDSSPRVLSSQRMGSRERDPETLVARLCQSDQSSLEFSMPTRAVLGRAFVLAKLNFLKALEYILEEADAEVQCQVEVLEELVGETVFSKLAEELLLALIANPFNSLDLRRMAARKLILMWDERLTLPVSELPTLVLSAWRARLKVRAVYGTLLGTNEFFSLIQAECEPRFVAHFVREQVTPDEREAFREFLFGLPYEDLEQVRVYMEENQLRVVSKEQVQELLGSPLYPYLFGEPSPEQMYHSYWRRRVRAEYRAISGHPGPRKTAEGYIMDFLLREELEPPTPDRCC